MKENKLSREELSGNLDKIAEDYEKEIGWNDEWEKTIKRIKECIHESYEIPDTSEREAELEEIIIKMQEQLDGYEAPINEGKLSGIAEKWLEEYWCEDWCDPSYYKIIKEWLIKFFKEAYDELKESGK